MAKLPAFLANLSKFGYVETQIVDSIVKNISYLPLGSILLENIKTEWGKDGEGINSYFLKDNPTVISNYDQHRQNSLGFLTSEKFRKNFLHVKNNFQKEVPLAIKEILTFDNNSQNATKINGNQLGINLSKGTLLSCSYFLSESVATENFFKIQRERKIWWMKFSSNPGRFFLSDLKQSNGKVQSVSLKSKFDFGEMEVENITLDPIKGSNIENPSDFHLKDVRFRRKIMPVVIRTEFCIESAVFALLLDAAECGSSKKLNIHRKIAPYQCSLFCMSEELGDLATHLTNVMRKSGITALNIEKCRVKEGEELQKELSKMDRFGIPYAIILEPSSLVNGLMKLRNRDTTISEIIHISDVPNYLIKIFNS